MTTTSGDASYQYVTPMDAGGGGNAKQVTVMSEAMCSPDADSPREDRERFIAIMSNYADRNETEEVEPSEV